VRLLVAAEDRQDGDLIGVSWLGRKVSTFHR
jgi:hypothetical protein